MKLTTNHIQEEDDVPTYSRMGLADFLIVTYWEKRLLSYSIVSTLIPYPVLFVFWLNKKECKKERSKMTNFSYFSFLKFFKNRGTPTASVSQEIAAVQRLLKKTGIKYSMHSAGTTLGMYMISVNTKYTPFLHFFEFLILNQILQKDHGMNV